MTLALDWFIDITRWLSRASGVVAAALIAGAAIVVCQMVVIRYFLGAGTIWQTEYVTYSIVAATLIGAPYVLLHKGHVNVELVPLYAGPRARLILALIAGIASLAFCLTIAVCGWVYFHEALTKGWRTETVWALPLWIPLLPLPLGMGLLSLQFVADILSLVTGREAPFGIGPEEGE